MAEIPIRAFLVSLVALRETADGVQVLLLRRTQSLAGEWCQVAGSIEKGETAWWAALRELKEETRLTPTKFYSADICEQFYEAHRNAITIAPVFVAYVEQGEVVLNEEHSEFRWVSFELAREMVPFPGQRRILSHIEAYFVLSEPSKWLEIDFSSWSS
ncbi:MAG: NUDIX domain-containing protein [Pseudomonadota bacterium]